MEATEPKRVKGLPADIISAVASVFDVQEPASAWHAQHFGTPRIAASLLLYSYAKLDFASIGNAFRISSEDAMRDVRRGQVLVDNMRPFQDAVMAATIDALGLDVPKPNLSNVQSMPLV